MAKHSTFFAARIQDAITGPKNAFLRWRGWVEAIVPFIGYGTDDQIRVLARVVLIPAKDADFFRRRAETFRHQRGWRSFIANPLPYCAATLTIGDTNVDLVTDRQGYIDVRIVNPGLEPGWHHVTLSTSQAQPTQATIQIISSSVSIGFVSDIDDTVLTTYLPRPLIAGWNTFALTEEARKTVAGMAEMYQEFVEQYPGAPLIYVSTGAWNTVPFLRRFLRRHGFPDGPFLLTDWGPTNTGWFRSGRDHKKRSLHELARDFPGIKWVLIGDDGQHDPQIYSEFAELRPDRVAAIGIRQLSPGEQFLSHGTPVTINHDDPMTWRPDSAPEVRGPDGFSLHPQLLEAIAGRLTPAPATGRRRFSRRGNRRK